MTHDFNVSELQDDEFIATVEMNRDFIDKRTLWACNIFPEFCVAPRDVSLKDSEPSKLSAVVPLKSFLTDAIF